MMLGGGRLDGRRFARRRRRQLRRQAGRCATPRAIAQALRKELIEASADTLGENVTKEDIRRKTEQGKSRSASRASRRRATFDPQPRHRTAASARCPAAVVQRYFIRR